MSKIICIGDLHLDIKEPHFNAGREFVRWFLDSEYNSSENIMLMLGDLYHHASPNPKVHELGIHFIKECKCFKKYILAGNHDFNKLQESWSIQPLSKIEDVELILTRTYLENFHNSGLNFLFLPFVYDKSRVLGNITQKDFYEQSFEKADFVHYVFHHLEDETISFNGDYNGINLSQYKNAKRVGGHIHHRQKGYLGSSIIGRFDEKDKKSYLLEIDLKTKEENYVELPRFLNYINLDYSVDKVPYSTLSSFENNGKGYFEYRIYDILNAPSRDEAYSKFKGLYIREVFLKKDESIEDQNLELNNSEVKNLGLMEHWKNFCIKNKVNKKVQSKVENYIK